MVLIANFRGGPSKFFKSSWYPGYQLLFLSGGPFGFPEKQLVLIRSGTNPSQPPPGYLHNLIKLIIRGKKGRGEQILKLLAILYKVCPKNAT